LADRNHIKAQNEKVNMEKMSKSRTLYSVVWCDDHGQ